VDFDGDGILDIVASGYSNHIYLYKGKGNFCYESAQFLKNTDGGDFLPSPIWPQGTSANFTSICLDDWNEDGLKDILVSNSEKAITWYRNVGSANAAVFETIGTVVQISGGGVVVNKGSFTVADLDRDGLKDLVIGGGTVSWCKNTGTNASPVFNTRSDVKLTDSTIIKMYGSGTDANDGPTHGDYTVCVTDLNGDNIPDLLIGDYTKWTMVTNNKYLYLFTGVGGVTKLKSVANAIAKPVLKFNGNLLQLDISDDNASVNLFSPQGKKIASWKGSDLRKGIKCESLAVGEYILRICGVKNSDKLIYRFVKCGH